MQCLGLSSTNLALLRVTTGSQESSVIISVLFYPIPSSDRRAPYQVYRYTGTINVP